MSNKEIKLNFKGVNKSDDKDSAKLEKMTAGLPDPGTARLERFKKRPRVSLNFKIPDLIKEEFMQKAIEKGYTREYSGITIADQIAFLYHMMREAGIDVPDDEHIDARRN